MSTEEKDAKIKKLDAWYKMLPPLAQLAVDKKCPEVENKDDEWIRRREAAIDTMYISVACCLMIIAAMVIGAIAKFGMLFA